MDHILLIIKQKECKNANNILIIDFVLKYYLIYHKVEREIKKVSEYSLTQVEYMLLIAMMYWKNY